MNIPTQLPVSPCVDLHAHATLNNQGVHDGMFVTQVEHEMSLSLSDVTADTFDVCIRDPINQLAIALIQAAIFY